MQATTERRQQMLEYISIHRHVQYQDLMDEFHISKKTAQRDVEILSCSYPIYTRTTCAGGIFAMEGWYASKSYLHDDQEALLRKLLAGLQPEDQKTMQSILDAFPIIFTYATFHEKEPVNSSTPVNTIKPRSMAFLKGV